MNSVLSLNQNKCKIAIICGLILEIAMILIICGIVMISDPTDFLISQNIVICRNLFCLIFAAILLFGFMRQGVYSMGQICFIMIDVVISIILFMDIFTWILDGRIEYKNINTFCVTVDIILNSILDYLFLIFIKDTYSNAPTEVQVRENKIAFVFVIIGFVMPILDAFMNFGFYIDEYGSMQSRIPTVFLLYISPLVLTINALIEIFKAKVVLKERLVLFIYIFAPLFSFAVYVIKDHGLESYYPIIFATYLFVFCNIVVNKEKENIQNKAKLDITKKELDIAASIQMSMLPVDFDNYKKHEVDIFAYMGAAKEVGGDFYDYFMLDKNKIVVIIADVSDKGIPAALFMSIGKALLAESIKKENDLPKALESVHRAILTNNSKGIFITLFAGIIDVENNTLTYTNAGHCPPLIKKKDEGYKYLEDVHGSFLGCKLFKDIKYGQSVISFAKGDLLCLYTDGVTEAQNTKGELYGSKRLIDDLNNFSLSARAEDVVKHVVNNVKTYAGDKQQTDDITILCVRLDT